MERAKGSKKGKREDINERKNKNIKTQGRWKVREREEHRKKLR